MPRETQTSSSAVLDLVASEVRLVLDNLDERLEFKKIHVNTEHGMHEKRASASPAKCPTSPAKIFVSSKIASIGFVFGLLRLYFGSAVKMENRLFLSRSKKVWVRLYSPPFSHRNPSFPYKQH
jgi:hypothetical protein